MESDHSEAECTLCYKIAENAVNCSNLQCNKLFCEKCYHKSLQKNSFQAPRCPFCRVQPFQTYISQHRNQINSILHLCKKCNENYKYIDQSKHKQNCSQRIVICKICKAESVVKNIVEHTMTKHKNELPQILLEYHEKEAAIYDVKQFLNKYQHLHKKVPHLGTTGKFYCSSSLGLQCKCCNQVCGPTNGENCVDCMRFDQLRRGLTKGQLVNSSGKVCRIEEKHFRCQTLIPYLEETCGDSGNYCNACVNATTTMERYEDLL